MRFQPQSDGRNLLYSVGWNQKDDGGVPGTGPRPLESGDWTWSLAAE